MLNDFKFSYVNIDKDELKTELNVKTKYYANVVHWTMIYSIPIFWLLDYLFLPSEWVELAFLRLTVAFIAHCFYLFGHKKHWLEENIMLIIIGVNVVLQSTICASVTLNHMLPYFLLFSIVFLLINITIVWKPKYSIILCLLAYATMIGVFKIVNIYDGYHAMVANGAGIFFIISAFSCLIASNKYQLVKRETAKNILINQANNRLLDQNEKITDQGKEIEEVNRKLQKVSEYRFNTLNMMLHDFRNFTGSIQMSLDLLKNDNDNLTDEQKEILGYINVGNEKLKYLSDKLAQSTDTNSTEIQYNNTRINLSQEVENIVMRLYDAATLKQLSVQLNIDPSPAYVFLDKIFLDQVLSKLFTNAIRYANVNSILSVYVHKIGTKVVVEIANKGKLIGSKKLKELFNNLDTLQVKGDIANKTALGFSVAKNLAEQMGGKLSYNSQENTGNFYRLEFNLTQ